MVNYTGWFTEGTNRKIQINSTAIYRSLSLEVVERLDSNLSVNEIIDWIRIKRREAFNSIYEKNPEVGALNNATGRWNEFIATSLLSELTSADRTIFTTAVAPHSIALEQNFKLVDGTYLYARKTDLMPLVESAITQ